MYKCRCKRVSVCKKRHASITGGRGFIYPSAHGRNKMAENLHPTTRRPPGHPTPGGRIRKREKEQMCHSRGGIRGRWGG